MMVHISLLIFLYSGRNSVLRHTSATPLINFNENALVYLTAEFSLKSLIFQHTTIKGCPPALACETHLLFLHFREESGSNFVKH